jgi:hypothetical protein
VVKVTRKPGPGAQALGDAVKGLKGAQAKVGWFPSAKYEDGTPVALVAVVHEYGSPAKGIPPRLGMRQLQEEKKAEWSKDSHVLAKAVVNGKMAPDAVMQGLAQKAEGDMRQHISQVWTPKLKPATIKARGRRHSKGYVSEKPLVDTGYLLNTLTSQVKKP